MFNFIIQRTSFKHYYGQRFFAYHILITAYHTGMRIGEILALRWENINLNARVIHVLENITEAKDDDGRIKILRGTPKTENSVRYVDISDTLAEILMSIRKYSKTSTGIVFFTKKNNTVIALTNLEKIWRQILKELGLEGKYTIHELRHTHATKLLAAGINIASISRCLGHSSVNTTLKVYSHAIRTDGRLMANIFDRENKAN